MRNPCGCWSSAMVRVFVISSVSGTRKFSKQYSKSMSRMYCVQRGLRATSIRSGRKSTKFWNGTKWQRSHTTFTRLAVNTVMRGVTVHRGCCTILGDEGGGGKVGEAAWTTEAIGFVQAGVCVELKTESLVVSWSLQTASSPHYCTITFPFVGRCDVYSHSYSEPHSNGPAE